MTKVLVVEDEPSAVAVVKYHFESAGVDGLYASRADEGWRMLVSHRPEAMVADITLPGEDGWSLIERVRRDGRFGGLPVVVLTGEVEEGEAARAKSLGCEYLTKPFSATALLTKLSSLLNRVTESPSHPPAGEPVPQIKLIGVGVVILLDHYRIEGTIHLPPELSRFSDAWESVVRDSRTFFPVTRAKLMSRDGITVLSSPAFVEVRKSEVRAVFPQDLTPAEGNGFLA